MEITEMGKWDMRNRVSKFQSCSNVTLGITRERHAVWIR